MTFTEAAVEILRRTGKPLHFKQIALDAVAAGLLSHVGQTPESTMGSRLLALARREHERKVIATDTGVFALAEWGLAPAVPALEGPTEPGVGEEAYRTRERHPALQDEFNPGGGRRDDRRRQRDDDDEGRRKKRYPPPAEVAHALLREKGDVLPLAELAKALREKDRIAEALERDLLSFEKALREENRRRQDGGRPPLFEISDDLKIRALELPREQPRPARPEPRERPEPRKGREERPEPRREEPRPVMQDEQRRQVLRSVRRRLAALDISSLERVAVSLLEAQGYRELNMARRSAKEGPLYLARHRWGAGELRYAVRVLRPGRDLGRPEVQDVRRDLGHYSAQIGIVFGTGECSREAKGEANTPNGVPVMLYGAEAFAEALVEAGLGVTRRMVEWVDFDDEFFARMGAGEALAESLEETFPAAPDDAASDQVAAPAASSGTAVATPGEPAREGGRRGRDRRRDRERGRVGSPAEGESAAAPPPSSQGAGERPAPVAASWGSVVAPICAPEAAPPEAAAVADRPTPASAPPAVEAVGSPDDGESSNG